MNENKEKLEEYSIFIIEERRKYVDVEAESEEEAIEKVRYMYNTCQINLDKEDVFRTEIW